MPSHEIPEDLQRHIEKIHEVETNYEAESFENALETLVSLSEEALSTREELSERDFSDLFES